MLTPSEVLPRLAIDSGEESQTKERVPDIRPVPPAGVTCPPCKGTGQTGGRPCPLCAGTGKPPDVAEDVADTEEREADPPGDG